APRPVCSPRHSSKGGGAGAARGARREGTPPGITSRECRAIRPEIEVDEDPVREQEVAVEAADDGEHLLSGDLEEPPVRRRQAEREADVLRLGRAAGAEVDEDRVAVVLRQRDAVRGPRPDEGLVKL